MTPSPIDAKASLEHILRQYADSFSSKTYNDENDDLDPLMNVFGITPTLKRENRQYWGRELGMCWQLLISEVFKKHRESDYAVGYRSGADELCDLVVGKMAIDTKYRIGSGDAGTLKKFKQYGQKLIRLGYDPIFLILRSDNLPAAIQACHVGGWRTLIGQHAFDFVQKEAGFDVLSFLNEMENKHAITRNPTSP